MVEELRRGGLRVDRTTIVIVSALAGDPVRVVQIQREQPLARIERDDLAIGADHLGRDLHAGVESAGADVLHIHHFVHGAAGHGAHRRKRLASAVLVVQCKLDGAHRDDVIRPADGRKVRPRTDRQQRHRQEEHRCDGPFLLHAQTTFLPDRMFLSTEFSLSLRPRAHAGNFCGIIISICARTAAAPPPAPGLKPSQSPQWGRRFRRPFGVKMLRNYVSNAAKAAVAFAKPSA